MLDTYIITDGKPSFGQLLRAARERIGLSQLELARKAKASRVPQIEQDAQGDVRFDTLKRLAEAVGQPISYFFGTELAKKPAKLELLERIARLDETQAEAFLAGTEEMLSGLEGEAGPTSALDPIDDEGEESPGQAGDR